MNLKSKQMVKYFITLVWEMLGPRVPLTRVQKGDEKSSPPPTPGLTHLSLSKTLSSTSCVVLEQSLHIYGFPSGEDYVKFMMVKYYKTIYFVFHPLSRLWIAQYSNYVISLLSCQVGNKWITFQTNILLFHLSYGSGLLWD